MFFWQGELDKGPIGEENAWQVGRTFFELKQNMWLPSHPLEKIYGEFHTLKNITAALSIRGSFKTSTADYLLMQRIFLFVILLLGR